MDIRLLAKYRKKKLAKRMFLITLMRDRSIKGIFQLDLIPPERSLFFFRFYNDDIRTLMHLLLIPPHFKGINGTTYSGLEALCILLRRLAYPNRLTELSYMFHRADTELSLIINYILRHIWNNFGYLLETLEQPWLSNENLQVMCNAVKEKGAPLDNCWGFIDGTVRPMCRPQTHQRVVYNGHKRVHSLKFQSVVAANGLIANLFGPIDGRRHDAFLLSESKVLSKLESKVDENGTPFCIYGDPAYPLRRQLIGPFKGSRLTPQEQLFNKRMSMNRIAVEWVFGKLLQNFAFVDFKKNLKLLLQPIGMYFKVAAILTNCHTCMYSSKTSMYFNLSPPDIEHYLKPR